MKRKKSASGSPSLDLKRFEIAALITLLLLLVSPLFTSAQTVDELQAQIQALLARVAALQGQMVGTSTPTQPPHPGDSDDYPTPTSIPSCPNLSITMQRGSRDATSGGQVTELQVFLANHFDLDEEDVVSGYFGKLTQQFVTKFQHKYGLPAFGIAGSLTRAKIASVCGGGPVVIPQLPTCMVQALRTACPTGQHYESAGPDTIDSNGCRFANLKCVSDSTSTATFSASPTSGSAPLTVQFTATNLDTASNTYPLDYGDGSQITIGGCGNGSPCYNYSITGHTYASAGTYTATLTYQPPSVPCNAPPGAACMMVLPPPVQVGTATITVTGGDTRSTNITVTAPNGGGYYSKGEPMHVQWTTTNIRFDSQMLIRLRSVGSGQEYNLTTTVNDGFERVDLSSVPAGSYTLEIKTAVNGQSYLDASDSYFKIVEPTPSVSITVNGQTTLTVQEGTYYTLAWSSQNVTSCTMYYARSNGGEPVTSSNSVVANTSDQTRMSAIVAYTLTCQSASGPVSQTATVFKTASQNPTFSAWPNSGTAPLTSHLTISGASSASGYSVNFGDGSSDYNWKADTETANTYFMSHTFQTAGTYTAALMYQPPSVPCSAPPGAACMMVMPTPVQVGTATITVAAQNCDAVSGCSYKVDPSTYPTQGVGGTSASSGANANLASALSALESALNELIRMFSTL